MSKERDIDWDIVDKLAACDVAGVGIAARLGIHPDTLYDRTREKYGMSWSLYTQKMKQKGIGFLKEKQFQKAMEGDNSMLIWVGKNMAGQSDNPKELAITESALDHFKAIMNQVKFNQSKDLSISDNSNNTDDKSQ